MVPNSQWVILVLMSSNQIENELVPSSSTKLKLESSHLRNQRRDTASSHVNFQPNAPFVLYEEQPGSSEYLMQAPYGMIS
jgi:hypothetical protein